MIIYGRKEGYLATTLFDETILVNYTSGLINP